jgi:PKD domain/Subtilase family
MDAPHARRVGPTTRVALAALVCCLLAAPAAGAKTAPAFKGTRYAKVSRVCPTPKPGYAACFALARVPVSSAAAGEAGVRPYAVNDGASESGPAGGLTPAQLASAYGYEPTSGGSGQTLAIVDAYDDPNIESDLATFDTEYGIAACTTANGCFTKVSQTGSTTSLPEADTTGWSVEISLDVEMAHSACPKCKILLVEANGASFANLASAEDEAVALGATEVSNSYGGPEQELGISAAYDHPGVVITAATGDNGYDDWTELNEGFVPPARPNMPASLPWVVAVGGTTLELNEDGKRKSERVWNGNGPLDERYFEGFSEGATGGGCSTLFTAQPWQQDAPGFAASGCAGKRLAADVSAVADPLTGFDIYDSYNCGEDCERFKRGEDWLTIGGTSLSTPLISALYALAGGSKGVSDPSLTLYGHLGEASALYDVTEGGNGFCDAAPESECGHPDGFDELVRGYALHVDCEYTTACDAAPGFDGPSGVGTPNSLSLFEPRQPSAAIATPSSPRAGVAATFSGAASSDPYPGGSISSYSWSWGDGTPDSAGIAPTHTYAAPGVYTVTLTVTDNYGLTSVPVTQSVTVAEGEAPANNEAGGAAPAEAPVNQGAQGVSGFQASLVPRPVPDAVLASTSLQVSSTGAVTLKISCPAGESSCSGSATLRTLSA